MPAPNQRWLKLRAGTKAQRCSSTRRAASAAACASTAAPPTAFQWAASSSNTPPPPAAARTYTNNPLPPGERGQGGGHLQLQPDRHGPIVLDVHQHVRPKDARLDVDSKLAQRLSEGVHQRRGHIRQRRATEAWTTAAAGIRVQRELRDNQGLAANIQQRQVHLAGSIVEDAQLG